MAFVVDASVAAAWFLPDEHSVEADLVMTSLADEPGLVPSLFWFETRNLFHTAERRGRLRDGEAMLSMLQLRGFPLHDEGAGQDGLVLALAKRRELSGYDASYLALAIDRNVALATCDRRLAVAARAEGVPLIGPLAGV